MANRARHLKLTPPKHRPTGIPDHIWALPARLVAISEERNLYQEDFASAAGVDQSTVARWLQYKGLSRFSTPTLLRLEAGLKLEAGTLLPRGNSLSDPDVSRLATTLGIDQGLLSKLKENGAVLNGYPQAARKAMMGVVHVYGVTIERAIEAVDEVIAKFGKTATRSFDAPMWFDAMRPQVVRVPTDESGTHPSDGKILIAKRRG